MSERLDLVVKNDFFFEWAINALQWSVFCDPLALIFIFLHNCFTSGADKSFNSISRSFISSPDFKNELTFKTSRHLSRSGISSYLIEFLAIQAFCEKKNRQNEGNSRNSALCNLRIKKDFCF